jgi:hypothetical protein
MSDKKIIFIIDEGDDCACDENQEYFACYVCGIIKYHEQINFTDDKSYCFKCAPKDDNN